jgi:hypothetical protein
MFGWRITAVDRFIPDSLDIEHWVAQIARTARQLKNSRATSLRIRADPAGTARSPGSPAARFMAGTRFATLTRDTFGS